MVVPEPIMLPSGEANGESGTKLYISELDYGVSNDDIKLLFSDVGELKRYSIHYDKSGRSKGTAEVVFSRQTDALAAIERYNNVQLDGKPMKIELVGVNLFAPPMPVTASSNMGKSHGALEGAFSKFDFWSILLSEIMKNQLASGKQLYIYPQLTCFRLSLDSDQGSYRARGWGRVVFVGGYARFQGQERRHGEELTADKLDAELERYHLEAMRIS
ncbi:hypothetical protein GH714_035726 [Hevea brasiliensis]|uniref:RRM domain-containing protein n=1 Tax=Hevea brasiliensis TaxID=3981 RepID=A0A6A6L3U6_HEVBR|nr:hypothetical protein GH714_035726 [Hevea brasiliensis]